MKLFLDTNVLVDHALERLTGQPYEAKFLITWALKNAIPLYISPGSFYTFTYVLQKEGIRNERLKKTLGIYLQIVNICSIDKECLSNALDFDGRDLEDSFQLHAAFGEKCDYLITNNVKDFKASSDTLVVLTAKSFVTNILKKRAGIDY